MAEQAARLYRSRTDKIIFGVCGGLAKYFDLDASLFRVLFVLLTLANGLGIIIYLALAILVAQEPGEPVEVDRGEKIKEFADEIGQKGKALAAEFKVKEIDRSKTKNILGAIIILVGLIMLLKRVAPFLMDWFRWDLAWPVLIIFIGIYLVFNKSKQA